MLEALAHQQLKALLVREGVPSWPHHLTLSRLVGRSLRRADHTLVRLLPGTDPGWWISLLVPLALSESPLALVLSDRQRQRLLQVEWPRLASAGLSLPCWVGEHAPPGERIWLLNHRELLMAWRQGHLGERQLVIPEAEDLELALREAMAVVVDPHHWEQLFRARPAAAETLIAAHQRLSQRVLGRGCGSLPQVALAPEDEAPLRQILQWITPLPDPWSRWIAAAGCGWTSWAEVDAALLQWQLHRQPLHPCEELKGLFHQRGAVLVGELASGRPADRPSATTVLGLDPAVVLDLGDPPLSDPLPLYAPLRQPLPNTPEFGDHLLDHGRRLVLGQKGLTVVLLDDESLRRSLASALAAEFGSRVIHQSTAPEPHGVILAGWAWWLAHQRRLPSPCQIIVGLLPIPSLENPLTSARVGLLRQQGRDWFRELLLPEAINLLQRGLAGLRRSGGRLAVLDGRLRYRSWGNQMLAALEPWVPLTRLLPD